MSFLPTHLRGRFPPYTMRFPLKYHFARLRRKPFPTALGIIKAPDWHFTHQQPPRIQHQAAIGAIGRP